MSGGGNPDAEENIASGKELRSRDLDFIFEVGSLRHVARTWRQFGGTNVANTAEHSFRVAWLALLIARQEGADLGRVALLALIHDLAETRTGDVNYLSRMYTTRDSDRAIEGIGANTSLQEDLQHLWREYEAGQSAEARVVKDADTLDCDFEISELGAQGSTFSRVFAKSRVGASRRLRTNAARAIYAALAEVDPNRWHMDAENRTNAGDWSSCKTED